MPVYRHRQFAPLILVLLVFVIAVTTAVLVFVPDPPLGARIVAAFVLLVLVGCLVCFHALVVEVDEQAITARFGVGWPRKCVPLERVRDVRVVRNRWWYGWGIRWTPHGWLLNVAGLDAIELERVDDRPLRIGTDEPELLVAAVRERLEARDREARDREARG